jgi:hypothetical protein
MYRPTLSAVVPVPVPAFELWLGLAWWVVGSVAFDSGPGTVVLAVGLVLAGWLLVTVRRVHGRGIPLPRGGRAELLRRGGVTLGLVVALTMALGWLGYGELAAPTACVLAGFALVRLARLVGSRATTIAGAVLVGLGVAGVVLALNSPGLLYGQGLVGLGAGAVLWAAGAYRTRVPVVLPGVRR